MVDNVKAPSLSLARANAPIAAPVSHAEHIGVLCTVTVPDDCGPLVSAGRMDGGTPDQDAEIAQAGTVG